MSIYIVLIEFGQVVVSAAGAAPMVWRSAVPAHSQWELHMQEREKHLIQHSRVMSRTCGEVLSHSYVPVACWCRGRAWVARGRRWKSGTDGSHRRRSQWRERQQRVCWKRRKMLVSSRECGRVWHESMRAAE